MEKFDFLYKAIDILFVPMVQSTIARENYMSATIKPFSAHILSSYKFWMDNYERSMTRNDLNEELADANLMKFLRKARSELVNNALTFFAKITKTHLSYDELLEIFLIFDNNKEIDNPFEQLLIYIRDSECKYINLENKKKMEASSMISIEPVVLFDDEMFSLLRQQNQLEKLNISEDGELAGHITYKNNCDDLSHLVSEERLQELFDEIVMGVQLDVE